MELSITVILLEMDSQGVRSPGLIRQDYSKPLSIETVLISTETVEYLIHLVHCLELQLGP
jgi:hypothetical protein